MAYSPLGILQHHLIKIIIWILYIMWAITPLLYTYLISKEVDIKLTLITIHSSSKRGSTIACWGSTKAYWGLIWIFYDGSTSYEFYSIFIWHCLCACLPYFHLYQVSTIGKYMNFLWYIVTNLLLVEYLSFM